MRPGRGLPAMAPAVVYLLALFVLPIVLLLSLSLGGNQSPAAQYARMFAAPVYFRVLANTFETGCAVTLATLVLAYPLAALLAGLPGRRAGILLGLVALPWFTSLLVRTYAWMVLLGQHGVINHALLALGLITQPLPLLYSAFGVDVSMVHILLPYMVLSLFAVMRGIDHRLLRAAEAAGATPFRAFLHVYLPLSLPGIAAGSLLVFIMAIGFYVTPALLGGPRQTMIAQLIGNEMLTSLNWQFGAALTSVLLAIIAVMLLLFNRFLGLTRLIGGLR